MNTASLRIARYAAAGIAGIASCVALATPALAMQPDPPAPGGLPSSTTTPPADTGSTSPTAGTIDWSSLAAGLGGGVVLGGAVVLGAAQARRHRSPQPA